MFEWSFLPNVEKKFIDYHMSSINETEFSFSQMYKPKKREIMSNNDYPLIKLDYDLDMNSSFERVLNERRTCISYFKNTREIDKHLISKFCNLAFVGSNKRRRTYPSGGSEYNVRIHILFNEKKTDSKLIEFGNISEINCDTGNLMLKNSQDWKEISNAFLQKHLVDTAQFSIVLSIDINSISQKYHDISYKLVQQEAGHIGQNIQLVSQYLGMQSVPLGGFYDTMLSNIIGEKQTVLYTFLVG